MTSLDDHVLWSLHTDYDERYTRRTPTSYNYELISSVLTEYEKSAFLIEYIESQASKSGAAILSPRKSETVYIGAPREIIEPVSFPSSLSLLPSEGSHVLSTTLANYVPCEDTEFTKNTGFQCGTVFVPPKLTPTIFPGGVCTFAPPVIANLLQHTSAASPAEYAAHLLRRLSSLRKVDLADSLPPGCDPLAELYAHVGTLFKDASEAVSGLRSSSKRNRIISMQQFTLLLNQSRNQDGTLSEELCFNLKANLPVQSSYGTSENKNGQHITSVSPAVIDLFSSINWFRDGLPSLNSSWFNPEAIRIYPPGTQLMEVTTATAPVLVMDENSGGHRHGNDGINNGLDQSGSQPTTMLSEELYSISHGIYSKLCMELLQKEILKWEAEGKGVMSIEEQQKMLEGVAASLWDKAVITAQQQQQL